MAEKRAATAVKRKDAISGGYIAICAQAALLVATVLPLVMAVPANLNIVLTASLCVFVGCWKSVKATPPAESMSQKVITFGHNVTLCEMAIPATMNDFEYG